MLLIPAVDLHGGRCVRLLHGDFSAETRYDVEPQALVEHYRDLGARWLHVVDLDGARDGKQANREIILALARLPAMHLQVGGGIRDSSSIDTLLHGGAARVVIGSAAVTNPDQVRMWLRRFGAEAITLAFDVRLDEGNVPRCTTHGWQLQTAISLWQALDAYRGSGLKHVLCTDVARDGAMTGPSLDLYREALRRFPDIEWQASGGVRSSADLTALAEVGAVAAICGRALLEEEISLGELGPFLQSA